MIKYILSIDLGSSISKYIIMKVDNDNISIRKKDLIRNNDINAIENNIKEILNNESIDVKNAELVLTGILSDKVKDNFVGMEAYCVDEFTASSYGVLLLQKLDRAIIANIGTGTSYVYSDLIDVRHIGGSGLGGGMLFGICKKLYKDISFDDAVKKISNGNLENVDTLISDLCDDKLLDLDKNLTASNLSKTNADTIDDDFSIGLFNAVCQNIGIEAIFARDIILKEKKFDKENLPIVFTGSILSHDIIKKLLDNIASDLKEKFFYVDDNIYNNAIGAYEYYLLRERKNF